MEIHNVDTRDDARTKVADLKARDRAGSTPRLYHIRRSPYRGYDVVVTDAETFADNLIDGLPTPPGGQLAAGFHEP